MYTRIVDCTLKPEKRAQFNAVLRDQILPQVRNQRGFVNLIGLTSDERPDHALAITFWNTKDDADRFYLQAAPMMDYLKPLVEKAVAEHYHMESSIFRIAATAA